MHQTWKQHQPYHLKDSVGVFSWSSDSWFSSLPLSFVINDNNTIFNTNNQIGVFNCINKSYLFRLNFFGTLFIFQSSSNRWIGVFWRSFDLRHWYPREPQLLSPSDLLSNATFLTSKFRCIRDVYYINCTTWRSWCKFTSWSVTAGFKVLTCFFIHKASTNGVLAPTVRFV